MIYNQNGISFKSLFFLIGLSLCFSHCSPEKNHQDDPNWAFYQGDPARNQYKNFDQINAGNASQLVKLWEYSSEKGIEVSNQIQCNPLVINGVLYGTSPSLKLFALDAKTGSEKWVFDPSEWLDDKYGTGVNRGLNFWQKQDDKRILYSVGPNLFAINAETGEPKSSFGENGVVNLKKGLDKDIENSYYGNNTPGAIFGNLLILGGRTSEGADHAPGHIRAFNVETGQIEWIFHTIPFPGEFGYDTWPDSAFHKSGGANAWAGFSVDPELGLVYAPTGSASFDFYGGDRHGQNLFANSIIALSAKTGERVWHFQIRHHDLWDRDLPAPPNLVTIQKDGQPIQALAQISKSGHLFVLNRETGEPIYPIEEVEVPPSTLEGEQAWPTQPVPSVYPQFSRGSISEVDIPIRSEQAQIAFQEAWAAETYGEFVPPTVNPRILFPGMDGGGEWGGASVDPEGIMYVNSNEMTWKFQLREYVPKSLGQSVYQANCQNCHAQDLTGNSIYGNIPNLQDVSIRRTLDQMKEIIQNGKSIMPPFAHLSIEEVDAVIGFITGKEEKTSSDSFEWPYPYVFGGYGKYLAEDGLPIIRPPWGQLTAVDLNTAEIKWQVPLGNVDSLQVEGYPVTGTENYGGPVSTSGDVIFIAATADEKFRVFQKSTGKLLWETQLPTGGYATPATYMVDGKQYVVIACGGGKLGSESGDRYVAFGLGE